MNVSTGTAGDGYRLPTVCRWRPGPTEPGQRPLCRDCGGERHEHAVVPTPRGGD